jgi:uncharacterized protein
MVHAERSVPGPENSPRAQAFGYICQRCCRCCFHHDIQVNPYEVARLARGLGETTTEFRANWTRDGAGTMLKRTETGACVFLGKDGCTVHPDRPLVCRLYPLGRHLTTEGVETFSKAELVPQSAGEFIKNGTIGAFIESQSAAPFIQAADDYFRWYCTAHLRLSAEENFADEEELTERSATGADILDMDAEIDRHCAATGAPEPTDFEERIELHLTLLYERLGVEGPKQ